MNALTKLGITPDPAGLLKAQTLFAQIAERLNAAIAAVKGRTSEALDSLRESITDEDEARVERVRDAFHLEAAQLQGEDRARFFLASLDMLSALQDWAEASAAEYVSETFKTNANETLESVRSEYKDAIALRDFATMQLAMLAQFGTEVPKGIKLKEKKVRGGGTSTVLDWPRISDPSNVNTGTGKRAYTTNLPVFTIDGNELPHGTNVRKVAVDHLSTEANPLNASALLTILEKNVGKDFKKKGGTVEVNGRKLTFTEWKPVGQDDDDNE